MDRRKTSMSESVSSELYDLELIETTCLENGLSCNRICDSEIEVTIAVEVGIAAAEGVRNVGDRFDRRAEHDLRRGGRDEPERDDDTR